MWVHTPVQLIQFKGVRQIFKICLYPCDLGSSNGVNKIWYGYGGQDADDGHDDEQFD